MLYYYYYFVDLSTHNMADNSNGNPDAGGFGLNQQNQQQQQNVVQGNNQNMDAARLAHQILANTNVTMKTEVVKLPDFYGQPDKDTIFALEFNLQNFTSDLVNSSFHLNNTQPLVQHAHSAPSPIQHFLSERKNKVNYRALHLGQEIQHATQEIKQKCKSMHKSVRKSAKAAVTKLALGAFSKKPANPATTPSSPHSTSSSFRKFWPSK
jgi:hypothetical protein